MNDKTKKIDGFEIKEHFTNCSIPYITTDGRLMAINDKYLAIPWIVKGQINIVKSNQPRNLSYLNLGIYKIEDSNILDMEFSPFNSNILAYCTESNSVFLTSIKEEEKGNTYSFKTMNYKNHEKKVNFVNFNQIASNIMCSCTTNGELHVWDSKQLKTIVENKVESPNAISWSPSGSVIGISTKYKNFNIYDPRNKNISFKKKISELYANNRFAWIDDNSIATIGWNSQSNKKLGLLDIRKPDHFFSSIIVDKESNQTNIFVDPELKLIYSVGKNETSVRTFGYDPGILYKSYEYICSEKNNFSISMNRRYLDKDRLEIDRLIRFTDNKKIYYVSFTFKNFQNIDFNGGIYPSEELSKPRLTSEQWIENQNPEIKKTIYARGQLENENKIQPQNSLQNKDQNSSNNSKKNVNVFINIKARQPNYPIQFKNSNIRNEGFQKPNLPKLPVQINNNENIENDCNNCYKLRKTIQQLEANNIALSNKITSNKVLYIY